MRTPGRCSSATKQAARMVGKQAAVWGARTMPRGGSIYWLKSVRVTDGAGVSMPACTRPSLMPGSVIGADKSPQSTERWPSTCLSVPTLKALIFTPCQDTHRLRNVYRKVQGNQNWQIPVFESHKATTNKTKWPFIVTESMMVMLHRGWPWSYSLGLKRADNQNWQGNKGGMGLRSAPCMLPQGNCKIGIRNRCLFINVGTDARSSERPHAAEYKNAIKSSK